MLDIASAWAVSHLDDGDAVLIVDETADEKSSADAAGAARQYSGTADGIALCQVAVTLTYATGRGHALIGRALYLPEARAADEEHRELAGVPEECCSPARRNCSATYRITHLSGTSPPGPESVKYRHPYGAPLDRPAAGCADLLAVRAERKPRHYYRLRPPRYRRRRCRHDSRSRLAPEAPRSGTSAPASTAGRCWR